MHDARGCQHDFKPTGVVGSQMTETECRKCGRVRRIVAFLGGTRQRQRVMLRVW